MTNKRIAIDHQIDSCIESKLQCIVEIAIEMGLEHGTHLVDKILSGNIGWEPANGKNQTEANSVSADECNSELNM